MASQSMSASASRATRTSRGLAASAAASAAAGADDEEAADEILLPGSWNPRALARLREAAAMRATREGKSHLGLTVEAEGSEPVIVVAESEEQRSAWLSAWRAAEEAIAHQAAGVAAAEAAKKRMADEKAAKEKAEKDALEAAMAEEKAAAAEKALTQMEG